MLMTPITPNVIASPIAASNNTDPSDKPYQTFCTWLISFRRASMAVTASAASAFTSASADALVERSAAMAPISARMRRMLIASSC